MKSIQPKHFILNALIVTTCIIMSVYKPVRADDEVQIESTDHFRNLVEITEDQNPSSKTRIKAARSAWALGLVNLARMEWERALDDDKLSSQERTQEILAQAILELQEGKYKLVREISLGTSEFLNNDSLKAQFNLLIGESYRLENKCDLAKEYYEEAINLFEDKNQDEAQFMLGECLFRLKEIEQARVAFLKISPKSQFSEKTIKRLIEIENIKENYENVITLAAENPNKSAEIGYYQIQAELRTKKITQASTSLKELKDKAGEFEPWYHLAQSEVEIALAEKSLNIKKGLNGKQS
jgi:hypothetical protein